MEKSKFKKREVSIPEEIIEGMPVTSATYLKSYITIGNSRAEETIFVLKEEDGITNVLAKMPCQIKHGLFEVGQVWTVVVMFYIWNTIYEIWWNYHEAGGEGAKCFEDMAIQDQIRIFFVTERKRIILHSQRKNELKQPFKRYLKTLKRSFLWSMKAFDQAKEEMYRRFPSKENLWDAL